MEDYPKDGLDGMTDDELMELFALTRYEHVAYEDENGQLITPFYVALKDALERLSRYSEVAA